MGANSLNVVMARQPIPQVEDMVKGVTEACSMSWILLKSPSRFYVSLCSCVTDSV